MPRAVPSTGLVRGRAIVLAQPFADARRFKHRCGMEENGFNFDPADALCAEPPHDWLARSLAAVLRAAGFRVLAPGDPAGGSAVRVDGTLVQFFAEPKVGFFTFSSETDIELHLRATSASGLEAERKFYVKRVEVSVGWVLLLEDHQRRWSSWHALV